MLHTAATSAASSNCSHTPLCPCSVQSSPRHRVYFLPMLCVRVCVCVGLYAVCVCMKLCSLQAAQQSYQEDLKPGVEWLERSHNSCNTNILVDLKCVKNHPGAHHTHPCSCCELDWKNWDMFIFYKNTQQNPEKKGFEESGWFIFHKCRISDVFRGYGIGLNKTL